MKLLKTLPILTLIYLLGQSSSGQSFSAPAKNDADYRYKSTFENAFYLSTEKHNYKGSVTSGHEFLWKSLANNNLGDQETISPGSTEEYFIDECSYTMQGYLSLYRTTGRIEYLHHFVRVVDNILQRRDDYRYGIDPARSNVDKPTWQKMHYISPEYNRFTDMLASGLLTYPMADFVYLIKVEQPALQSQNMISYSAPVFPASSGIDPLTTTFSGMSYLAIAQYLESRVRETLNHHESDWISKNYVVLGNVLNAGYFEYGTFFFKENGVLIDGRWSQPLNLQASMGRTYLMMWKATGAGNFEDKARRIANNLKLNMLRFRLKSGNDKYWWNYWDVVNSKYKLGDYELSTKDRREDMSHASYDVHFAYLCYKYNLKYRSGSTNNVFDLNDMNRLVNTLKNTYLLGKNKVTYLVTGSERDEYDDLAANNIEGWVPYIEFDADLYPIFSEGFTNDIPLENGFTKGALNKNIRCSSSTVSAKYLSALAHLKEHERNFNPLWETGHSSSSDWTSATTGDLNGNGVPEVIVVRNSDQTIYGYEFSETNSGSCTNGSLTYHYKYKLPHWQNGLLTVGDFDGNGKDELAVLHKHSNSLIFLKNIVGNENLVPVYATINNFNFYSSYSGITAMDDANGDGKDEIIITDYHKLHIMMSDVTSSGIDFNTILNAGKFGPSSNLVGAARGDIDGDGVREFITARNHDSNIYGYTLNSTGSLSSKGAMLLNFPTNTMKWRGITCGDFDADQKDEIALSAESDGDIYIYKYTSPGVISGSIAREQYLPGYKNFILAAGNVFRRDKFTEGYYYEDEPCCPRDELIMLRNLDGHISIYETNLPSGCPFAVKLQCNGATGDDDGINTNGRVMEIKAYPNPTQSVISFELMASDDTKVNLKLFDSKGVQVRQFMQETAIAKGYNTFTFQLNQLQPGMYIYQLNEGQTQESGTIIITP